MRTFSVSSSTPEPSRRHLSDPKARWEAGYSAYELAHCWHGAGGFPAKVGAALSRAEPLAGAELIEAFFGREVPLDTGEAPSLCDLLVFGHATCGHFVMAVEGRVEESFGELVRIWCDSPAKRARLEVLCSRIGLDESAAQSLRYRLLLLTAAVLIEASRYRVEHAVVLVHSFEPRHEGLDDYQRLVEALGLDAGSAVPGRMVGPRRVGRIQLHLGWVHDLPLADRDRQPRQASKVVRRTQPSEPSQVRRVHQAPPSSPKAQDGLDQIIEQIWRTLPGGRAKTAQSVSSSLASGFKRRTGRDYRKYFDQAQRGEIAELGVTHGIGSRLLVDLLVAMRDLDAREKDVHISMLLRHFRERAHSWSE